MTFFFCEPHFHGSHRWSSSWRLDLSVFQAPSSNGSPIVTHTVVCLFASKIPGLWPRCTGLEDSSYIIYISLPWPACTSVWASLQDFAKVQEPVLISKAGGQGTHLVLAEVRIWLDPGLDTFLCPPSWVNSAPSQKMRQQKKFLIEAFKIMSLPTLFGQFSIEFFVVALMNQTPPHSFYPGFLCQLLQPGSPLDSLLLLTSSIRQNCTNVASLPPYYLYMDLHLYVPARLQGLFHGPLGTALCVPFSAGTFTPKKPCL